MAGTVLVVLVVVVAGTVLVVLVVVAGTVLVVLVGATVVSAGLGGVEPDASPDPSPSVHAASVLAMVPARN